jgi:FtsH-binding integral membrane protein
VSSVTGQEILAQKIGANSKSTTSPFKTFLNRHFYFWMSLVFAAIVVWGFSRSIDANLFHAAPPRPVLLWIHGTAFSMWVVFFIAQSSLVRVHKVSVHRSLGWFGTGLAVVMVPLGFTIAVIMARFDTVVLQRSDAAPFLAIPFFDMITFGVCVALAINWRKRPDFHRRLLFIATCGLMDAAVGRFAFVFDHNLFYPCLDLLIVLGVARDLVVERRVHKVYLYALPALIVGQVIAVYAWRVNPPWWQSVTRVFMG